MPAPINMPTCMTLTDYNDGAESRTWKCPRKTAKDPPGLLHATMTEVGQHGIFMFGGQSKRLSNVVYKCDPSAWTWSIVDTAGVRCWPGLFPLSFCGPISLIARPFHCQMDLVWKLLNTHRHAMGVIQIVGEMLSNTAIHAGCALSQARSHSCVGFLGLADCVWRPERVLSAQ